METFNFCIKLPKSTFADGQLDNLKKLVKSKEHLIRKAIGAEALPVIETEFSVEFPWFSGEANDEEVKAYMEFITSLVRAAKERTRITAKDRDVENEKYAFRCFLLRLGFIGDEHKTTRKILLRNFKGSAAFKSGAKKEYAPGCEPIPTQENTVRVDIEEAKKRLKDPAVQEEIKALLNGGEEE